jgi:hypothetical protein
MKEGQANFPFFESYSFTLSVPIWIPIVVTIGILLIVFAVRRNRK